MRGASTLRSLLVVACVVAMLAIIGFSARKCFRKFQGEDDPYAGSAPPSPTAPQSTAKVGSPEEQARQQIAEGHPWSAAETLAGSHSDEALDLMLVILEVPFDPNKRLDLVKALSKWPDHHEKIADAFVLLLPSSFSTEIKVICQTLADWDMKSCAPALAEMLAHSNERDCFEPVSHALEKIGTPECVPTLLSVIPATEEDCLKADRIAGGNSSFIPRLKAVIEALGGIRDPRAVDVLVLHFNRYHVSEGGKLGGYLWETVSEALGKIGTEESIAAMQSKVEQEKDPSRRAWLRRKLLPGLMRSRHAQGRSALAEALASDDRWLRQQAVEALVETAEAADVGLILKAISDPDPLLTQRALRLVPLIAPESNTQVEQACDQLMKARRFRTALKLAEKIADAKRTDEAKKGLEKLRADLMSKPRVHEWLGLTKGPLQSKFPKARHIEGGIELVSINGGRSHTWMLEDKAQGVNLSTDVFGDGPCQHIHLTAPYGDAVYGVKIGDPAALAWEIQGETVGDPWLAWRWNVTDKARISLSYSYDGNCKITEAVVQETNR